MSCFRSFRRCGLLTYALASSQILHSRCVVARPFSGVRSAPLREDPRDSAKRDNAGSSLWSFGSVLAGSILLTSGTAQAVNDRQEQAGNQARQEAGQQARPNWPPGRFDVSLIDDPNYLRDKGGNVMSDAKIIIDIGVSVGEEEEEEEEEREEEEEDDDCPAGL